MKYIGLNYKPMVYICTKHLYIASDTATVELIIHIEIDNIQMFYDGMSNNAHLKLFLVRKEVNAGNIV